MSITLGAIALVFFSILFRMGGRSGGGGDGGDDGGVWGGSGFYFFSRCPRQIICRIVSKKPVSKWFLKLEIGSGSL